MNAALCEVLPEFVKSFQENVDQLIRRQLLQRTKFLHLLWQRAPGNSANLRLLMGCFGRMMTYAALYEYKICVNVQDYVIPAVSVATASL